MGASQPERGLVFLDACCLINLFATGRIEEVLESLPHRFATSELVADEEVLAIRSAPDAGGDRERVSVSPRTLEPGRHVRILPIATDREKAEFVRFAAELDDGEASVCSLAVVHGGGVATDDRKALRLLRREILGGPVLETPELLFEWARRIRASEDDVRRVVSAVRDRARFQPGKDAPHFAWWQHHLSASGS